jgi:predicted small metal-binding protein
METKMIRSPKEMTELIEKVIEEAKKNHGLTISGVQAQQIIAKSYSK